MSEAVGSPEPQSPESGLPADGAATEAGGAADAPLETRAARRRAAAPPKRSIPWKWIVVGAGAVLVVAVAALVIPKLLPKSAAYEAGRDFGQTGLPVNEASKEAARAALDSPELESGLKAKCASESEANYQGEEGGKADWVDGCVAGAVDAIEKLASS